MPFCISCEISFPFLISSHPALCCFQAQAYFLEQTVPAVTVRAAGTVLLLQPVPLLEPGSTHLYTILSWCKSSRPQQISAA